MHQRSLLLLFLGLSFGAHADSVSDENARLKQQISILQSRVDTLERACPVAAKTDATAPAAPPAKAVTQTEVPAPSESVVANANIDGTPQPRDERPANVPPPKKYADTGCDRSLFRGPKAGSWQSPASWQKLAVGSSMPDVESALGVEHYDVDRGKGRIEWQYGKCGSSWEGEVVFANGGVVSLSPPDR